MKLKEYFKKMEELKTKNLMVEFNKTKRSYYRDCYKLCEELDWDAKLIEKRASEEEMIVSTILNHAQTYIFNYLDMSVGAFLKKYRNYLETSDNYVEKIKDDPKKSDNFNRPINLIFRNLQELDIEKDKELIIKLIGNSGFDAGYLKSEAFDHVMVYFPEEKDSLIDELRAKVSVYIEYAKEERKQAKLAEEQLQKESRRKQALTVASYIKDFIGSDTNRKKDFCSIKGISLDFFDNAIALIKEFDEELYQKYLEKIDAQRTERFAIIISKIKIMIDQIKNGVIESDNTTRDFDLIDYYLTVNMDFNKVIEICQKSLTVEELKTIRTFIAKNRNYTYAKPSVISTILNGNYEVNCKKDESGIPIAGTGRMITLEEKQFMIDYLKKWNIPINNKTYNLVQTRYLNGKLTNLTDDDNLENTAPSRKMH